MKTFETRLIQLRKGQRLTQQTLAEKMGVTKASVCLWEKGTLPKEDRRARLAHILGTTEAYLYDGATPPAPGVGETLATYDLGGYYILRHADPMIADTIKLAKQTVVEVGILGRELQYTHMPDNSMTPCIPKGTLLGVHLISQVNHSGKVYLVKQAGQYRVCTLYTLPMDRLRMRFWNNTEYEDEVYPQTDPLFPVVVGRVFWWAVVDPV